MATKVSLTAKVGAILWLIWSVLHLWVGYEGFNQYMKADAPLGQWKMLIGGDKAPHSQFKYPTDAATKYASSRLVLNFTCDVSGYGALGLWIAYKIWSEASWEAFLIGLVIIGWCDLAFTFSLLMGGVIEPKFEAMLGPIVWVVAVIVTPIGILSSSSSVGKNSNTKNK